MYDLHLRSHMYVHHMQRCFFSYYNLICSTHESYRIEWQLGMAIANKKSFFVCCIWLQNVKKQNV